METFPDEELKIGTNTCNCSFTMFENDGLVDVQTAKCNSKCNGEGKVKLGGPAPSANLYNLEIMVSGGSVTVSKITAALVTQNNNTKSLNYDQSFHFHACTVFNIDFCL